MLVHEESLTLAAPPLLPALGRAVIPHAAAWPAMQPPQSMRDSESDLARAGREQLRQVRRRAAGLPASAGPRRSWSEEAADDAHQQVGVANTSGSVLLTAGTPSIAQL